MITFFSLLDFSLLDNFITRTLFVKKHQNTKLNYTVNSVQNKQCPIRAPSNKRIGFCRSKDNWSITSTIIIYDSFIIIFSIFFSCKSCSLPGFFTFPIQPIVKTFSICQFHCRRKIIWTRKSIVFIGNIVIIPTIPYNTPFYLLQE